MNRPIEKENTPNCVDAIASKTISSPTKSSPTPLIYRRKSCQPLEDHDSNSQDSGFYSVLSDDSNSLNRLIDSQSIGKKRNLSLNIYRSKSFAYPTFVPNNTDDAFIDSVSQNSLPDEFNNLIVGDICCQKSPIIKPVLKQKNLRNSTGMSQKSDLPFEDIKNIEGVVRKRKLFDEFECTSEVSDTSKKLKHNVDLSMSFGSPRLNITKTSSTAPVFDRKTTLFDYGFCKKSTLKFQRSFSTTEDTINAAFEKESNGLNLIGDFSHSYILPLLSFSRHADLHSISPDTLAQLLNGVYDDYINSYLIIDCRYPYEYEGGHIRGAVNIFTKEHLLQSYNEDKLIEKSSKTENTNKKRNILIFHCEFSSERGPTLSRYLRNADRHKNSICYPFLDHPEIYLLDGGYCKFFNQYSCLCEPSNYRSMYDPAHMEDLKMFRSKSKTGTGINNKKETRLPRKNTLRRLGFN